MIQVFDKDWESSKALSNDTLESAMEIPVRRVAKIVARNIHMKPMVEEVLERVLDRTSGDVPFEPDEVVQTVRDAFREEIHDAVLLALRDMAKQATALQTRSVHKQQQGCQAIPVDGTCWSSAAIQQHAEAVWRAATPLGR